MPRNRSLPPHLEIRRAGYFWRRRLPRSLRDRGAPWPDLPEEENTTRPKKAFLCLSLRNQILRDAKILARRLTEMSDLVFAADAETMMAIAPEIQGRMLESLARFEIEAFERMRAVAAPRSPEAAAQDLRREEALQTTLRQAIYLGDRQVAQRPLHHVAAHLGIALDEADEDWTALAYEATKVLLDISQERSRRHQGIYEQPSLFLRRAVGEVLMDMQLIDQNPFSIRPDGADLEATLRKVDRQHAETRRHRCALCSVPMEPSWHMRCRWWGHPPHQFSTRRSSTRATPRGLFGRSGSMIDHSKSVSS